MADRVFKPALAAACVALLLAVAASVAAPKGDAKGGSAPRQVTSTGIKNGTIKNRDIAPNAITGARINEGSLKTVPDAGAVGGNQVARISYRGTVGGPATKILDLGGLQLNAACSAGPVLALEAGTTIPGSALLSATTDVTGPRGTPENAVHQPSMAANAVVPLLPGPDAPLVGSLRFMGAGGQVVTVEFATELAAGGGDCAVTGHAFFG